MRYGKRNCRLLDVNLLKTKSFFSHLYNNLWCLALRNCIELNQEIPLSSRPNKIDPQHITFINIQKQSRSNENGVIYLTQFHSPFQKRIICP